MNKKLLIVSLSLCFLLMGCGKIPTLQDGKEVVTKLNGKNFSAEDLYSEMKKTSGYSTMINMIDSYIASKEIKDEKSASSYADSQIKQMKSYYESQGYEFKDMLVSNGFEDENSFKQYLIDQYKQREVAKNYYKNHLEDKEIQGYYNSEIFGEMTVRHVLIKVDADDNASDADKKKAKDKALKEANDIISKLKKGEKIEDLAKKYSDDEGTASEGGLYSNFTKQDTDANFWKASYDLKVNEYTTKPVESEYGYHVIYKVSQKDKPKLDEVKDSIVDTLVNEKMEDDNAIELAWIEVRKEYKMDIVDSNIKKSYDKYIKDLQKNK